MKHALVLNNHDIKSVVMSYFGINHPDKVHFNDDGSITVILGEQMPVDVSVYKAASNGDTAAKHNYAKSWPGPSLAERYQQYPPIGEWPTISSKPPIETKDEWTLKMMYLAYGDVIDGLALKSDEEALILVAEYNMNFIDKYFQDLVLEMFDIYDLVQANESQYKKYQFLDDVGGVVTASTDKLYGDHNRSNEIIEEHISNRHHCIFAFDPAYYSMYDVLDVTKQIYHLYVTNRLPSDTKITYKCFRWYPDYLDCVYACYKWLLKVAPGLASEFNYTHTFKED